MKALLPLVGLLVLSCSTPAAAPERLGPGGVDRPAWAAPPLERAVSVRDLATGETIGLDELVRRLARAEVVFLGETHDDETTHRVELAVYEGLLAQRGGRVVLALEMFERDVQPLLTRYVRSEIDEPAFLAGARPWKNYATAYRPLIERARADRRPVLASNYPAPLRRRPAGGPLSDEERALVPAELLPSSVAYWRRVDNAVRGHMGISSGPADPAERVGSTQSLWDNSMAETCVRARAHHPDHLVLHVNGGFHSAYRDGTVAQLLKRAPDARVLTVDIVPSSQPAVAEPLGLPTADFVVYAERRASDVDDGAHGVFVARESKLHVEAPAGAGEGRLPLLLWFTDDGSLPEDGLALWRSRLGDEAVLAVLAAPYRETQEDLGEGGRWFWADTFRQDVAAVVETAERSWAYLLRHYPVDPERVVLAGEGTGATSVAATVLLSERLSARGLVFEPRASRKLGDFPLPLPELWGDDPMPRRSLTAFVAEGDHGWWQGELAQYATVGIETRLEAPPGDPWSAELEQENALRRALGLEPRASSTGSFREHMVVEGARARRWARRAAIERGLEQNRPVAVLSAPPPEGNSSEVPLAVAPSDYSGALPARSLPRAPGDFGGTTVLVVPEEAEEGERAEWLALEGADPVAAASRFHRLRVAVQGGEGDLAAVLEKLAGEGRNNVLVVPADFCADGDTMRALRRSVGDLAERMTLHWSAGLGG